MWWDWAKTFRDIEAMTWAEFLELRQGMMTIMEYVARFTELAGHANNYVATDLAKVRRFENGLKLSIWGQDCGPPPT